MNESFPDWNYKKNVLETDYNMAKDPVDWESFEMVKSLVWLVHRQTCLVLAYIFLVDLQFPVLTGL